MPSFIKVLILIGFTLIMMILLCLGFELYLRLTDPFLRLPFDSSYYKNHQDHYPDLEPPEIAMERKITWGHPVEENLFGFRARRLDRPKSPDICRILVLGDSFTWGIGLDRQERYTNLADDKLRQNFPGRKIEVVNWSISGWTTAEQRDALRNYKDWLHPDLVVIGFVLNDPQPEDQDYTAEREAFYQRYGETLDTLSDNLTRLGLARTSKTFQAALDNFLVWSGVIPSWEVGMQRTYEPDSKEWANFTQALRDIKRMSDELALPQPFFIVLNQDNFWHEPTAYTNMDPALPIYLRWYHQAEQAAVEAGFRSYHHEKELLEQVNPDEIPLNELNNHPSARVHEVYAEKLAATLAEELEQGRLCSSPSSHQVAAATAEPLAPKRLLSVKVGENIRFLGYTADTSALETQGLIRLNFGWQALADVEDSYEIVLELWDQARQARLRQEVLPCQGDCLTVFWPKGLIALPGTEMIYWPDEAAVMPTPLEELPYQGNFRDSHELILEKQQLPAGDYLLTLALSDRSTGENLPVQDEIAEGSSFEDRIVLGKISILANQ